MDFEDLAVSFLEWGSVRYSDLGTRISPNTVWALHGGLYFDPMHPCIHLLQSALHHYWCHFR